MGHEAEPAAHVIGSQVLPLCGISSSTTSDADYNISDASVNPKKKRKAISRMKELLRWAAAAKSPDKLVNNKRWKVLYFGHKSGGHKNVCEETSPRSSKISFRWDVGSCSASSSAFSPMSISIASSFAGHPPLVRQNSDECSFKMESCLSPKSDVYVRTGNWITTDSEYVVLEL